MDKRDLVTLSEAAEILAARGQPFDRDWLRRKAAGGHIEGAERVGDRYRGTWLVPREWAETYEKSTRGRPRKQK